MDEYGAENSGISSPDNAMASKKEDSSYDHVTSRDLKYVNGQRSSLEYVPSKLSEFVTNSFQSYTSLHSLQSESSPYSLRQSQLSTPYKYDVLLMYDPDDDVYYLNELLQHLAPQQLNIFDFNRDTPAGLPAQKVLQDTLKMCRYTCIMITHKFITNYWLQFRADMSIQDMLDNREKLYSVIVIVMDRTVTKHDLPLDLVTLSPLFIGDRYFKDKIARTFSKEMPFPPSVRTASSFAKQPLPISRLPPSYSDISRLDMYPRTPQTMAYHNSHAAAAEHSGIHAKFPDTDIKRALLAANYEDDKRSIKSGTFSQFNSLESSSRFPQEHGDSTYLMPPSLFPSYDSEPSAQFASRVIERGVSITVSSTGSREPQELLESVSDRDMKTNDNQDSAVLPKPVDSSATSTSTSEGNASIETTGSSQGNRFVEDFSFLNSTDGANIDQCLGNIRLHYEHPAFFSISNTDFMHSNRSDYSDLEISESSGVHLTATLENEESLHNLSVASRSTAASMRFPSRLQTDISYSSLPRASMSNVADRSVMPRCNSLEQDQAKVCSQKKLSQITNDASCSSLPERSAKEDLNNPGPKRSFSMRSLFGSQKSKMNKFFKGKKN